MPVKYNDVKIALSTTLLRKINNSAKNNNREAEKEIAHILNDYFKIEPELQKYKTMCAMLETDNVELIHQKYAMHNAACEKTEETGVNYRPVNIVMKGWVVDDIKKLARLKGSDPGTEFSLACQYYIKIFEALKPFENSECSDAVSIFFDSCLKEINKYGEYVDIIRELTEKIDALECDVQHLKEG